MKPCGFVIFLPLEKRQKNGGALQVHQRGGRENHRPHRQGGNRI